MTAQVDFYVLSQTDTAAKHTYACRIANKAFGQGMTVFIATEDAAQSQMLDKLLWTFAQNSFVPHVVCDDFSRHPRSPRLTERGGDESGGGDGDGDGDPHPRHPRSLLSGGGDKTLARYPVQIGAGAAPHTFDLLISLRAQAPADYANFARVAELIIDDDDDKTAGRARFKFYREQGITPNTHNIS